jgi:hypothetical protein
MKKSILFLALLFTTISLAQEKYKYAIIPNKFSILKSDNQYNLNVISKKMLESHGLITYFENEIPDNFNTCEALFLDLSQDNNMFSTKLFIDLKDCRNTIIFKSDAGISREKDYKKSYNDALREASKSLQNFDFLNKIKTQKSEIAKIEPQKTEISKPENPKITNNQNSNVYKLEKNTNGYQLLNQNNDVIAQLLKTSNPSIFIIKTIDYQGIANVSFKNCRVEYYNFNMQLIEKNYTLE